VRWTDEKEAAWRSGGPPLTYSANGLHCRGEVTWDRAKNLANQKRHGISFQEASELFRSGVDYLEQFDDDHSDVEDRFIAIGPIRRGLVMVVWTERDGDVVRIISARWATGNEQTLFRSYIRRLT
jgi:uncharacterized DUF497 family protein